MAARVVRKLDSDKFNETLAKLFHELHDKISHLSPEAMKELPVELVDRYRKIAPAEFVFDNDANVNGVDGYKLNSMLRELEANAVEFHVLRFTASCVNSENTWTSEAGVSEVVLGLDTATAVHVPVGWDGRNSFVIPEVNIIKGMTRGFSKKGDGYQFHIVPNKDDIRIIVHAPSHEKLTLPTVIKFTILLWRRKNSV